MRRRALSPPSPEGPVTTSRRPARELHAFVRLLLLGGLALLLTHAPSLAAPPARTLQGVWLSPDWILPGTQGYDEARVRSIVRDTMEGLEKQGINTVFMEALLRGTSIASGDGLPVYPHLQWLYDTRGRRSIDVLQIVIDEASQHDIEVHAWVHMFYWRMDNDDIFKPWQRARSIWDDLLVAWMSEQCTSLARQRAQPALQQVLERSAASIRSGGVDGRALSAILQQAGYDSGGRPLGRLVHEVLNAGGSAPDFLLIGSSEDPFPRTPNRTLCPIYINPASPRAQQRIIAAIRAISQGHPDLAGIQLDHVRYPTEAQGIPSDWEPRGREAVYFNRGIAVMAERYNRYHTLMSERREILTRLVNRIRTEIHRGQQLSAAVLPLYYVERSDGVDRFNGYDYSAQDWHAWPVDFVVPMMYGFDPWRIRTLIRRFDDEARALAGPRPAPLIVPGVSRLQMARSGLLGNDDFVYFDLSLGLDLHYEKDRDEDFTWKPRREP